MLAIESYHDYISWDCFESNYSIGSVTSVPIIFLPEAKFVSLQVHVGSLCTLKYVLFCNLYYIKYFYTWSNCSVITYLARKLHVNGKAHLKHCMKMQMSHSLTSITNFTGTVSWLVTLHQNPSGIQKGESVKCG